ncbi:MAG: hypothetical protein NVV63_14670 [Opitutus sp.]|nr:hypothetical protein [Opitutus sp.]
MSHSAVSSPPPLASLRRTFARLWDEPDSRSVLIGLAGVVLVHLLLFVTTPHLLNFDGSASVLRPHSSSREFSIEIAPDAFVSKQETRQPPPPANFVETNPDAPENIPDRTNNFGAHNQQAAQEIPDPTGTNDRPAIEGQTEIQTSQIVTGSLTQPLDLQPAPAVPAETQPPTEAADAPQREQNPLPGIAKMEGQDANGFGTNIAETTEDATDVAERVEGQKNVPLIQGATGTRPVVDPQRPRPRPQIVRQQQVRPAIFTENKLGTKNIGPAAYDARWSNYGQYLQRMIESVQIQWERILIESRVYPTSGTSVSVKFRINTKGEIYEIVSVEGTAGKQAEKSMHLGDHLALALRHLDRRHGRSPG